jgi:pyruvate dehydrogenase E1 component
MSSFIAAGTAYATHSLNMIPFFIFYSMFGFQRIGDLIWAAGDIRARGFLVGGTSGRTTLAGEGLQHQDGHSHVHALSIPNLRAYDPAYAYELAVIIQDGIRRMYVEQESIFYYLTVMNEFYKMPAMPKGVEEGILRGLYRFRPSSNKRAKFKAHLLGSGTILNEALRAQEMLEKKFDVAADVWSVTSYQQLYRDAIETERRNRLRASGEAEAPYIARALADAKGVFVAASDYLKVLPLSVAQWIPGPLTPLGTDGFGRSDNRASLREFFEVNANHIAWAALMALAAENKFKTEDLRKAAKELSIDPEKDNPVIA